MPCHIVWDAAFVKSSGGRTEELLTAKGAKKSRKERKGIIAFFSLPSLQFFSAIFAIKG
jgi:hypothetical protein